MESKNENNKKKMYFNDLKVLLYSLEENIRYEICFSLGFISFLIIFQALSIKKLLNFS